MQQIGEKRSSVTDFSLLLAVKTLLQQELVLAWRQRGGWLNPLFFFLLVVAMFPLGVSPKEAQLKLMAGGVIWVSALLATLLAAENLFKQDYEDGSLEQLLVSPCPLFLVVLVKVFVHWLTTGFCLALMAPFLGGMLYLEFDQILLLLLSLLIGTPALSFISAIGAALTVGIRRGGILIALIVLPLYVPVLIFGTAAVQTVEQGYDGFGQLALLGALSIMSIVLAPFAAAMALRLQSDA